MDFGARQVIIVRNDNAREVLRRELGDTGLILTLIESKGLYMISIKIVSTLTCWIRARVR
jgi:hypothetical protein